jgi:protein subunit release factor B
MAVSNGPGIGAFRRLASTNPDFDEDPVRVPVPRTRLSVSFARSSGSGGQNVNKVNTKAELRFCAYSASWLPAEVRDRLLRANPARVNAKGEFFVTSERHRTQKQNIEDALAKLQDLVDIACVAPKERKIRTGLSKETKRQRVEMKRRRSDVKSRRRGGGSRDD